MAALTSLRNIGKEMERKLKSVGITTAEGLKEIGSKEAFIKLKLLYPNACVVYLYTLEGAISDVDYNKLPKEVKQDLKDFSDIVYEKTLAWRQLESDLNEGRRSGEENGWIPAEKVREQLKETNIGKINIPYPTVPT